MTDKQKQERDSLKYEIKVREILLKRLKHPAELLEVAAKKDNDHREERVNNAREYKTFEEAQDAYGWGMISEDELMRITKALEEDEEYKETTRTPTEIANEMLREFMTKLEGDIRSFRFELLPPEEQERIHKESEERRARVMARKGGAYEQGLNEREN